MFRAFWYNYLGDRHWKKAKKLPQNTVSAMYHYGLAKLNYKQAIAHAGAERDKIKRLKAWLAKWEK